MNDQAIDQAILSILSAAEGRWKKVAMLIGKVANGMDKDLAEGEDGYKRISQRIEVLVNEARLIAQGDIKNRRSSEVRLAN